MRRPLSTSRWGLAALDGATASGNLLPHLTPATFGLASLYSRMHNRFRSKTNINKYKIKNC